MKAQDDFLAGVPIEVNPARIENELSRLWKPQDHAAEGAEGGAVTRACLSNLVVYLEDRAAYEEAVPVLQELGKNFPSRMILLVADSDRGSKLQAFVSAICHVPVKGSPPVCCEMLTLRAPPQDVDLLAGSVGCLLVSDVPAALVLAWERDTSGELGLVRLLDGVVDGLVVDSRRRALAYLDHVGRQTAAQRPGLRVDDLSWYELGTWRQFLADIFDDPLLGPLLGGIVRVEVVFASDDAGAAGAKGAPPASLLVGWLASRLGWSDCRRGRDGASVVFRRRDRGGSQDVVVSLRPQAAKAWVPGAVLGVRLEAGGDSFVHVERVQGPDALRAKGSTPEACVLPRLLPLHPRSTAALLWRVLERPDANPGIFLESLRSARALVGA